MEKDQLARSIREIPFRLMAERAKINQKTFMSIVYENAAGKVFLANDCADRFHWIANYLIRKEWPAIEASILAKRKEMLLVQIDDGKRHYCNAMEMCVLMSKSGIPMSSGFRNFYSEVKPSAMSRQYQDYTKISSLYFAQEFCLFVPGYGPIFPAIVNYSLDAHFNEDNLFKSLVLGSIFGNHFQAFLTNLIPVLSNEKMICAD